MLIHIVSVSHIEVEYAYEHVEMLLKLVEYDYTSHWTLFCEKKITQTYRLLIDRNNEFKLLIVT